MAGAETLPWGLLSAQLFVVLRMGSLTTSLHRGAESEPGLPVLLSQGRAWSPASPSPPLLLPLLGTCSSKFGVGENQI